MYNAISIALVGNECLSENLRIATCLELFVNCEFCAHHPLLNHIYSNNLELSASQNNVFAQSINDASLVFFDRKKCNHFVSDTRTIVSQSTPTVSHSSATVAQAINTLSKKSTFTRTITRKSPIDNVNDVSIYDLGLHYNRNSPIMRCTN